MLALARHNLHNQGAKPHSNLQGGGGAVHLGQALLEAKPAPKPAPKGKQVELFTMRLKVGKGFYSTAPDAPDGQ